MWHPCTSNCEGGPGCADHIDGVYGLTCAEAAEYGCVSDLWRFSCAAGAADCIDADIPHYTYVVELCPRTCGECDRTYGEYHVNEDGLLTDIWDEIAPVPSCAPEPLDCREEPKDADNNHCEVPDVCEAADCTEPFTKLKDSPGECQGGACTAAECCTAFECTDAADAARQEGGPRSLGAIAPNSHSGTTPIVVQQPAPSFLRELKEAEGPVRMLP